MKQLNNLPSRQAGETIKISVIIITRNRAKLLSGCLDSLVKQTRLPDEVIVVDNASSDNTKKVILTFAKKLPVKYVLEKQVGMPYARNKGIQHTTGELILMLDDDCRADRFWVERMIHAHRKYPKAWVVQGRTYSLPKTKLYSLLAEFDNFIFVLSYAKISLPLKTFFHMYFKDEIELLTCETKNFSIKANYLKRHKFSFDKNFYRGSDIDFGKQILQKSGLIMFCPTATVAHWERPTLAQFLNQRWHVGRTVARVSNKWRTPSLSTKLILGPKKLLAFLVFCKAFGQLHNLPILIALLLLDRLYYLNGWFYEKKTFSLAKL